MKYLMKLSLVFILGLSLFSCSDLENENADLGVVAENFGLNSDCLNLVYPVTFTLPDDSEIVADSKEDLKAAVSAWKEENPGERAKPSIVFPVDVTNAEGDLTTVTSAEELKELRQACKGDKGNRGKCFELVYPVSYTMEDGSTITGADRAEIKEAFKAYKEANPDTSVRPELQYPIQIVNSEGETVDIASAEELSAIKEACPQKEGRTRCFELVYPVSYTMEDGSTITGSDRAELKEAFQAYKEANPDTSVKPVLQFPIQIVNAEGETVDVASEEELAAIKAACREEGGGKGRKGGRK